MFLKSPFLSCFIPTAKQRCLLSRSYLSISKKKQVPETSQMCSMVDIGIHRIALASSLKIKEKQDGTQTQHQTSQRGATGEVTPVILEVTCLDSGKPTSTITTLCKKKQTHNTFEFITPWIHIHFLPYEWILIFSKIIFAPSRSCFIKLWPLESMRVLSPD